MLTLVHFSAQPEPFLTQNTLGTPLLPSDISLTPRKQPLHASPISHKAVMVSQKLDECKPLCGGERDHADELHRCGPPALPRVQQSHGRAVQVEPIKPKLTAPGPEHLKLQCDTAFKLCIQFQLAPLQHGSRVPVSDTT